MPWQQLTVTTSRKLAPAFEELLENSGALSVTFTDASDQPIYEPPLDTTPLWQNVLVTGLFEDDHDLQSIQTLFTDTIANNNAWTMQIERLEDQVWERVWFDNFQPIKFGDNFWICSTEHTPPEPDATILWLDPGLAFGTGTHPTTALCLEWLAHQQLVGKTVFDFGCGSGILAIAALLMGADSAVGIDIDPQALTATLSNAKKNNVQHNINICDTEQYPKAACNIVIANILAEPLTELSANISALVKPNGQLILSGILAEQIEQVTSAYQDAFIFQKPNIKDNWACLQATKK
ncbi:MAG: 50S ribosomal protein L11 methyltransferase [Piscirickettsiaceae bacterium]|nr:MAG: 50S ribosomal protein L11 methyltransferase [Piscirickettsiaceae bacterium]